MTAYNPPTFVINSLDRMDHLRSGCGDLAHSEKTRFLFVPDGNIVIRKSDHCCLFSLDELPDISVSPNESIFLGGREDQFFFATPQKIEGDDFEEIGLRDFVTRDLLPEEDTGMLAEANSVLRWHESHRFCAKCGAQSVLSYGGWRRDCPSCNAQHFPRTDPVAIMLVTHGDYCLLGSGLGFTENRYSCLAGFIEPGETVEDGARRELFEEAGVIGGDVTYMLSQPWPFPSNLMIGVHVKAKRMDLEIDHNELIDAKWIHKSDIIEVLNGAEDRFFSLPPRIAIARTLLEMWVF